MTNKMKKIVAAAAENLDKVDNSLNDGNSNCECNFGDCQNADCCFNICRSIVINVCGLEFD